MSAAEVLAGASVAGCADVAWSDCDVGLVSCTGAGLPFTAVAWSHGVVSRFGSGGGDESLMMETDLDKQSLIMFHLQTGVFV